MKTDIKKVIYDIFMLTLGSGIVATGVFFFLEPSHCAISSIAGLAIILNHFIPYSVALITLVINVSLLLLGFMFCGKEFGAKTVYTTICLPIIIGLYEHFLPKRNSFTGDITLDVIAYIFISSIGLSILFNMNASSGGLDIVAKIMNKYLHMNFGKALSISGMIIAFSSAFAYSSKIVVISVVGTYINGLVLDHFIFDHNIKRRVCIIPKDIEATRNFVINNLRSGASIYEITGGYRGEKRRELITIVDKNEYQILLNYLQKFEPKAFVTVYTVSDVRYIPKRIEENFNGNGLNRDLDININSEFDNDPV